MKKMLVILLVSIPLLLQAQETQFWGNAERYLQRQDFVDGFAPHYSTLTISL